MVNKVLTHGASHKRKMRRIQKEKDGEGIEIEIKENRIVGKLSSE